MTVLLPGIGAVVLVGLAAAGVLLAMRQNAYRRLFHYDPRRNCEAAFNGSQVETHSLRCDAGGLALPEQKSGVTSALLEVDVRASIAGNWFDPAIEIGAGGFSDTIVLERGVGGVRLVNVSRLLQHNPPPVGGVTIQGHRVEWKPASAKLHVCRERPAINERVLVIAPHPDDAEIAAFGLYADTGATVVTITAGDASDRYTGAGGMSVLLPRSTIARMRVWDSITVPQLGGISPEQAINLGYPDECLDAMRREPERDFRGEGDCALDFSGLRHLNRSPHLRNGALCTWNSLVADLAHVLAAVQPSVIVTPHPWLDPHEDHLLATAAVCAALSEAS
ncbi:MAG TPA: PIG-L family deacetylase, partial [Verrucomicrobiae bacterium]